MGFFDSFRKSTSRGPSSHSATSEDSDHVATSPHRESLSTSHLPTPQTPFVNLQKKSSTIDFAFLHQTNPLSHNGVRPVSLVVPDFPDIPSHDLDARPRAVSFRDDTNEDIQAHAMSDSDRQASYATTSSSDEADEAQKFYNAGIQFQQKGDYAHATTCFSEAHKLEEANVHYIFALSQSASAQAKVEADKNHIDLGEDLRRLSQSARQDDEHLRASSPTDGASFGRAPSSPSYNKCVETIEMIEAKACYAEGEKLMRSGEFGHAIRKYNDAIKLDNTRPEYANSLAFAHYVRCKDGDIAKAESYCQAITSTNPKYGPAHHTLGTIYRYKASQDREEGNDDGARDFQKKAMDEFRLSKHHQTKKDSSYYVEKGALFLQCGEIQSAKEYLEKAKQLLSKRKDNEEGVYTTKKGNVLEYIEELQAIIADILLKDGAIKERTVVDKVLLRKARIDHDIDLDQAQQTAVKRAVDGFKLQIPLKAMKEMRAEMESLRSQMEESQQNIHKIEIVVEHKVDRVEVSAAIRDNARKEHVHQQETIISTRHEWREYYDAFRSMFSNAYTAAQVVTAGSFVLDVGGLVQQGISTALGFIPFCGSAISTIFDKGANAYQIAMIKKNAKLFLSMAPTPQNLEVIVGEVALDLTTHATKAKAIVECKAEPPVTGLLSKIIDKCKKVKASIDSKLDGGELYKTLYAKLGVQDAIEAIKSFLEYACTLNTFADKNEAIECLKYAIISEEDWSVVAAYSDVQFGVMGDVDTHHGHLSHQVSSIHINIIKALADFEGEVTSV